MSEPYVMIGSTNKKTWFVMDGVNKDSALTEAIEQDLVEYLLLPHRRSRLKRKMIQARKRTAPR